MKRLWVMFFILIWLLGAAACASDPAGTGLRFTAEVIEQNGDHVLVRALDGDVLRSADQFYFSRKGLEDIEIAQGDILELAYSGDIQETYPAGIQVLEWKLAKKAEELDGGAEQKTLGDRRPMILYDGVLYLDTGREATGITCGTPDAVVASSVGSGEIPTQHCQTNFGAVGAGIISVPEGVAIEINGRNALFAAQEEH